MSQQRADYCFGNVTMSGNDISTSSGDLILNSETRVVKVDDINLVRGSGGSFLALKGGTNDNSTSQITMYAENHLTNAGDIIIQTDTKLSLHDELDGEYAVFNSNTDSLLIDTIHEYTADAGVTIDSVLLKEGLVDVFSRV
mmetsp:Transcript_6532/g.24552  ORF Transcript_6532/g.24552 Transcript_6532/m.24552 type:complete len:141 (+) Transcript_6532:422-844(+)|eukprot:CAMPEP_0117444230 /NCGR_PEP_ID=MMETSP0759-20121206/5126_1 /TAXON_ID=63605 /ORGANISM="Percolomonas cosmopolitus, Strain WS" /LENGTH=140 /DNA_ID=CAMNT_0005236275 /DNA_START=184 /DNA_END=606 /DNA_ORIENTATION=+